MDNLKLKRKAKRIEEQNLVLKQQIQSDYEDKEMESIEQYVKKRLA